MTDVSKNKGISDEVDATSGLPVEAALMCTAMAIVTVLIPAYESSIDYLNEAMILGFSGFVLFLISKISLVSSGRMASWGPRPMRSKFKAAYIIGYLLMVLGMLGMITAL
jgi:hypothetical protein